MEVTVLAKRMQDIPVAHPFRGGWQYGNAIRRHSFHQPVPAIVEFLDGYQ
jgi:hypothetical protein